MASPWLAEPDRVEGSTETGLPFLILRHPRFLHLLGYVSIPPGHPLFDVDCDDLTEYGFATYSADRAPGEKPDGRWWFGFDFGHAGDLSPGHPSPFPGGVYRTIDDARDEVERLGRYLASVEARDEYGWAV